MIRHDMTYVTTDAWQPCPSFVCHEGCCVVGWDDELDPDRNTAGPVPPHIGVSTVRPMFEVLDIDCLTVEDGDCCCYDDLDEQDWEINRKIMASIEDDARQVEQEFFELFRQAIAADQHV